MARPQKEGLDYFSLDVVLDDKVELMEAKCGLEGFAILIKLWQKIYREGYYIDWQEDNIILFSRKINVETTLVNSVVTECLTRGIFDIDLYDDYKILTSKGIQKRYLITYKQLKRSYVPMKEQYLLVNSELTDIITELISDDGEVNMELMQQKKRKEKKGKESKGKEIILPENEDEEDPEIEAENDEEISPEKQDPVPYQNIMDLYNTICTSYPKIIKVEGNRRKAVAARWKTYKNIKLFENLFTLTEESDFLKGNNDRNWSADFDWIMKADNFVKVQEGKYNKKAKNKQPQKNDNPFIEMMQDELKKEAQKNDKS